MATDVDQTATGFEATVRRAEAAYRSVDERLGGVGGIAPVVALYEQVRTQLEDIDYAELDRVAAEIRGAVETLLRMDAAIRKLNNLKVLFEREQRSGAIDAE